MKLNSSYYIICILLSVLAACNYDRGMLLGTFDNSTCVFSPVDTSWNLTSITIIGDVEVSNASKIVVAPIAKAEIDLCGLTLDEQEQIDLASGTALLLSFEKKTETLDPQNTCSAILYFSEEPITQIYSMTQ